MKGVPELFQIGGQRKRTDLQGRDPAELKVAVAAARKGKPFFNRGQAKKEVNSSRVVTVGDDR